MSKNTISMICLLLAIVLLGGLFLNLFDSLDAPEIEVLNYEYVGEAIVDTNIKITPVEGATKYAIYLDGEFYDYVEKTSFSVDDLMGLEGGTYDLQVRAVAKGWFGKESFSDYSNTIEVSSVAG